VGIGGARARKVDALHSVNGAALAGSRIKPHSSVAAVVGARIVAFTKNSVDAAELRVLRWKAAGFASGAGCGATGAQARLRPEGNPLRVGIAALLERCLQGSTSAASLWANGVIFVEDALANVQTVDTPKVCLAAGGACLALLLLVQREDGRGVRGLIDGWRASLACVRLSHAIPSNANLPSTVEKRTAILRVAQQSRCSLEF